jgi:glycosyltransferase involved in cell wall biosynthesis
MGRTFRIVSVTHFFPSRRGGIELVAAAINRRLAERGHEVAWFASADAETPGTDGGLSYHPMQNCDLVERLTGLPLPIWIGRGIPALWSAIRDCDAVHIHDFIYPGSLLALAFARVHGKTTVLTQHIGEIPYSSKVLSATLSAVNRTVGSLALRCASRVVFISNVVQAYFCARIAFPRTPLYLPNGVNTQLFHSVPASERIAIRARLGIPENAPVCLFVGRMVEKKGLHLLLPLVARLPAIHWIFVGQGPLRSELAPSSNVRIFDGLAHADLADLYRAADLLVLPSRGEGFPLVVQEAFACGLPALVSDETAAGCEAGRPLLFELSVTAPDTVEQWQRRLADLTADRATLEARRGAVAEFARQAWSWDHAVDVYTKLYQGCVE